MIQIGFREFALHCITSEEPWHCGAGENILQREITALCSNLLRAKLLIWACNVIIPAQPSLEVLCDLRTDWLMSPLRHYLVNQKDLLTGKPSLAIIHYTWFYFHCISFGGEISFIFREKTVNTFWSFIIKLLQNSDQLLQKSPQRDSPVVKSYSYWYCNMPKQILHIQVKGSIYHKIYHLSYCFWAAWTAC